MIQKYRGTENNLKLSTLIVYTFDLSDILSDLFISNSTLFIVFKIGSILILKVSVSGSLLYSEINRFQNWTTVWRKETVMFSWSSKVDGHSKSVLRTWTSISHWIISPYIESGRSLKLVLRKWTVIQHQSMLNTTVNKKWPVTSNWSFFEKSSKSVSNLIRYFESIRSMGVKFYQFGGTAF